MHKHGVSSGPTSGPKSGDIHDWNNKRFDNFYDVLSHFVLIPIESTIGFYSTRFYEIYFGCKRTF